MSCTDIAPLLELTPLFSGDLAAFDLLEAGEIEALEEHLARCDDCRRRADALKGVYGECAAVSEDSMQPLSTDLRERVLADRRSPAKKKPAAVAPDVDPVAVEAVRAKVVLSCSFCHDAMERVGSVFCAACLAPHHRDCFDDHGRCSMPGCEETRSVRPQEREARPGKRRGGVLALLLLSVGVGGGIAAWSALRAPALPLSPRKARGVTDDGEDDLGSARLRDASSAAAVGSVRSSDEQPMRRPIEPIRIVNELPRTDPEPPVARGAKPRFEVSGDAGALSLDFREPTPLGLAVAAMSKVAGRNAVVSPYVSETVLVSLREIPYREAIDVVARMARCEVEELPGGVLYLLQPPKVTIQFTDADVRTILRLVAAYSGKNVILGPGVQGTTGVDFKEVNWEQALETIAGNVGAYVTWVGQDVIVTATPLPEGAVVSAPTQVVLFPAFSPPPPHTLAELSKRWSCTEREALDRLEREAAQSRAQRIDLELNAADLAEVCDAIGTRVGQAILVDPSINETLSLNLTEVAWPDAVGVLARLTRCEVEVRPSGLMLLAQPPLAQLTADGCSAPALYRLLAAYAGKNMALNENVTGRITAELSAIPWVNSLRYLAAAYGHRVEEPSEDMLSISARPGALPASPARRKAKKLSAFEKRREALLGEIAKLARRERHAELRAKQAELQRLLEAETVGPLRSRDPVRLAAAKERVDAVFAQIEELAREGKTVELITHFGELSEVMEAFTRLETNEAALNEALDVWYERLDSWGEVKQSVRLQMAISAGNTHLRAMAEAIRRERYRDALGSLRRLEKVGAGMKLQEREVFHRNAEALLLRGRTLGDRARRLQEIKALPLELTAVVFVPDDADATPAAVVNDRVLREGDTPVDREGEPLDGVRLLKIERSSVRFRYEDTEFIRRLRG